MNNYSEESLTNLLKGYSSQFEENVRDTAIILAAGHGKRIKSNTSKMLHKIWEIPTVERVADACLKGFTELNIIIVVGIKAADVIKTLGKKKSQSFAYQEVQHGTGHAVQVGMENISDNYEGHIYVFPGDMGLIDGESIAFFKNEFNNSNSDMMVLTGIFEGAIEDNYYGRIIRVKENDINGNPSTDAGKVIEIKEYKDILSLNDNIPYIASFNKSEYSFTKSELINNREYNSGVFAFKYKPLSELIKKLGSNNVQNEIYITDLIDIFNKHDYNVGAVSPLNQYVVMGFNNKSVLLEMNEIAKKNIYEKIKDITTIEDPNDFFIHEDVVDNLLRQDAEGTILDVVISKGVYIGKNVKLEPGVKISRNTRIEGDISIKKNVTIHENCNISCYYGQKIILNENCEIFGGNIITGNVEIGENTKIGSMVKISGSDSYPTRIEDNCKIKGVSYIFGSTIESNFDIENSILNKKILSKPVNFKGERFSVKNYTEIMEGTDAVKEK
jgi:bifunctional UDP-N-acetylglucosamine pyrophosphorylase/glucosamine-1-phosphate N-acetyltransferase